ncbi:20005_t:CDS:2, partial [Racocetra persica]
QYAISTNIEDESINESQLVFYYVLTDCETQWSSTFNAWGHLLILRPFIDILSTTINVKNVDVKTKKDGKHQDELKDAFDDLQFEDEEEDDEPKAKQRIKINNPVNTIGLIDAIKDKFYYAINVYYKDLELDGLVASFLDPY